MVNYSITTRPATDAGRRIYHIEVPIPKSVFNKKYLENPKTFGEHLQKARIDAGAGHELRKGID
jgi:hypothetical protein